MDDIDREWFWVERTEAALQRIYRALADDETNPDATIDLGEQSCDHRSMAGHSQSRHDVWTDAGRKQGEMFKIAVDVSPSQAYAMMRWLELDGWGVRVDPAASPGRHSRRPRPEGFS
jgi:hypothetical protein